MVSSITDTKELIEFIESLNLSEYDIEDLKKFLNTSLSYPYFTFPQVGGSRIFRGQICNENPYDKISRLSYNPKPASNLGRANIKQESVFYAAGTLDNAAIESCQDELKKGAKIFFVTVGEWLLKSQLEINVVCHSKKAQSRGTDIIVAAESIDEIMRKGRTEEQYQVLLLKSEFFADQFAKSEIGSDDDYAISALYSSQILHHHKKVCDGICYPSVAYKLKSFNFVYRKELFDTGFFEFVCAYHVKLTFNDTITYPKIEILGNSNEHQGDTIKW